MFQIAETTEAALTAVTNRTEKHGDEDVPEPSVGRLLDEGTNTSGPRGTYGCACAHHDGSMCAWIRYGGDGPEDPCECLCHGWPEDEDDYLG